LKPELGAGEEAVEFTCAVELVATGTYKNVATVTASKKEVPSNEVEAELKREAFEVVKEQKFVGEGNFTTAKLVSTKIPNTVEYQIIVKNTGETTILVERLTDGNCLATMGPLKGELLPGEEAVEFTCSHEITAAGIDKNVAAVTGNGKEVPSNEVEAELLTEGFQIIKEQKLSTQTAFTKEKLSAKVGEKADYRITVTNSGEMAQTFTSFSD